MRSLSRLQVWKIHWRKIGLPNSHILGLPQEAQSRENCSSPGDRSDLGVKKILKKHERVTHPKYSGWRIPWPYSPLVLKSHTTEQLFNMSLSRISESMEEYRVQENLYFQRKWASRYRRKFYFLGGSFPVHSESGIGSCWEEGRKRQKIDDWTFSFPSLPPPFITNPPLSAESHHSLLGLQGPENREEWPSHI